MFLHHSLANIRYIMTKKSTLEKWFTEVWVNENSAMIHKMFVPDKKEGASGLKKNQEIGPDEFLTFHKMLLVLIKVNKLTIDSYMENGDNIFAECTIHAVDHKTRKKSISVGGCVTARIKEGKIKTANNYFDFLNLFEDLDLLPENTFATCLSGKRIS